MNDILLILILIAALVGLGALGVYTHNLREQLQRQREEKDGIIAGLRQQLTDYQHETIYKRAMMLALANSAYNALLVVDKDYRVIAINESAEALFEQPDATGKALIDVTAVPDLEEMVNDALTNQEESFEEQITIRERYFRVQSRVIRQEGHLFIGLALQDITQLVRLNRARRDMVANISHELRTPIANIRMIIDGLFHDQDKPKRKDSISSLQAIARETDALLWLVQEMSDLSMIESGQAIVRLVDVPLTELVEDAVERMDDFSEQKHITMVRHIPEKLRALCDRDLAQRVLVNLMHNAIKWSPPGEAVTIEAMHSGDEVTISVNDNGPGVPPEQVDRIFERFYQVDVSRSGSDGSGLGLAICRHIVEAHGGRIWAEDNRDGGGGRFRFTLLRAEEDGEPRQQEEPSTDQPA
jgi:two-component system, OmpR family, phosphate regulon sensor histidine kinase PhoR